MALVETTAWEALAPTLTASLTADQIAGYLAAAESAAARYVGVPSLESEAATEYYDGSGDPELVLGRRPVRAVAGVYLDPTGARGQKSGAFASTTLLTAGDDYVWSPDGRLTLLRVPLSAAGLWSGGRFSTFGFSGIRSPGGLWVAWPKLPGCVKVTYTAGYTAADADIVRAVCEIAGFMATYTETGGVAAGSASFIDVSESAAGFVVEQLARGATPALGSARATLDRIRDVRVPGRLW